jgi:hypothetical protein
VSIGGKGMVWVPRGVDPATREVLVEGIPVYMRQPLFDWLRGQLAYYGRATGTWLFQEGVLNGFDLVARPANPFAPRAKGRWPGFVESLGDEELLDLVDWLIHRPGAKDAVTLEEMLTNASSAWTVGKRNGNIGLIHRVVEPVKDAAERAMSQGAPGALLGEAWAACFARNPNPEEAYEKAIKAVEEAAAHLVSPKNSRATLGSMVRDMRAQADWAVDLPGAHRDVVVDMMEALWTGQESRHGGNGYRVPTQAEAETAVMLAVPLVQWFSSGSIARRP